jgi:DNA-binding transcriptional regulator GbsR (MarR family)
MSEIDEIKKDIYTTFAEIASTIGYSKIHGRIIAALLVSNKKLSLQELAKETGYSTSTISLSLDLLEFLGMIKKIKEVGDRKLYIELKGDLLEGVKKAFIIKLQKSITDTLSKFEEHKKVLKNSRNSKDKKVINILNVLEKEVKRLDRYVNLLSKLRLV